MRYRKRDQETFHFVNINQQIPKSSFKGVYVLPQIRTLLLVAGIFSVMALLAPVAQAITIRLAEVQSEVAVVNGRKAAANQDITWEGLYVTMANKRGSFSFEGAVPSDCVGTLSDTVTTIDVELNDCTPDSGGEPIPKLILDEERPAAHKGDAVRAVAFIADGALVISGGEDANLRSWRTLQLDVEGVQTLDHTIYDLESSVDGSIVATGEGGWNGGPGSDTLRIWNAHGFLEAGTRAPIGFVYCVAISPDNRWTVASGFYGDIVVYDTFGLELHATRKTKKKRTKALAFAPDGTILASTSTAGRIQLWSFPQDECGPLSCELDLLPVSLSHWGSWYFPIAFAPDNPSDVIEIVSGTDSGMIKVWTIDKLDYANQSVLSVDSGAVYSLAWSPDGSMIVAGGNGDITVYDAGTLEILFQNVDAHTSRVNDVAFSPDSSQIVSGGDDGELKLWCLDAAQCQE
jgi:WD40 repeat protein